LIKKESKMTEITCPIEPSDTISKMKEKLKEAIEKYGYDEVRKTLEELIITMIAIIIVVLILGWFFLV